MEHGDEVLSVIRNEKVLKRLDENGEQNGPAAFLSFYRSVLILIWLFSILL